MTSNHARAIGAAALAGGLALAGWGLRAAQVQGPMTPQPGTTVQEPPPGAIRVRVELVRVPVSVIGAKGEPILDMHQKEFHVYDNGVEQTVGAFDLGGEELSVALIFETSSRVSPILPAVQKSAILFTQTIVGPSGEAAVLGYDSTIGRLLPFSTDNDKIEKTIAELRPGDSGAHLYDAMSTAVGMLRDRPMEKRRAIVVVGEAADSGSEEKLGRVLRDAQLSNVVIYSVGISTMSAGARSQPTQSGPPAATPPGTFGAPSFPGQAQTPASQAQYNGNIDLMGLAEWAVRNVTAVVKERPLDVAAVATGGTFQSTVRDNKIESAIDAIGGDINSQYVLSYRPTGSDSGYHQIRVTVDRPGVKVRTRPGYFLEGNK
jgi:VWFA-related protein